MIKRLFFITILLTLVLTACRGASPTVTEDTPPVEETATATVVEQTQEPVPTEEIFSPSPTTSEVDTGTVSSPPGCTVVSPITGPDPTPESPFPPVSDDDWVVGPEDATITFVEYSDFQ